MTIRNWIGPIVFSIGLLPIQCACSANVANLTDNDIDRIAKLSEIAQSWGPEGRLRIRAGRPFLAGLFEGVLVIPGVEIDMDASADPARAPATLPVHDPTAETEPPAIEKVIEVGKAPSAPLDPDIEYPVTVMRGKIEKQLVFKGDQLIVSE